MNRPYLEVNLGALRANLDYFRANMRPETKVMAMVKADAYGAGSVRVAQVLERAGVDYLGVARTEEGARLREARILIPVMVMIADEDRLADLHRFNLEPEVYSIGFLSRLADTGLPFKIHIKFNTGMNRAGLEEADLAALRDILSAHPQLDVRSLFTHLAATPLPEHDRFTHVQVQRFRRLAEASGVRAMHHVLNSNGVLRFPQYHFDMVRLGIGLYGAGVAGAPLATVNTLKARIVQLRMVSPAETVSYDRSGKLERPTLVATVNIGYADGVSRRLGNGRFRVLVRGRRVPILGIVCMDLCMIDVTDVPHVRVGDEVVFFGDGLPVEETAGAAGTIPYEVFTSVSGRVERRYLD